MKEKEGFILKGDYEFIYNFIKNYEQQNPSLVQKSLKKLQTLVDYTDLVMFLEDFKSKKEIFYDYSYRVQPAYDEKAAAAVNYLIQTKGFFYYINAIFDAYHIGDHRNLYRKLLIALNVMRGEDSYLCETIAQSGRGKSFEDYIVFEKLIPPEFVFKRNLTTLAAFTRQAENDPRFFDRLIILFGDLGAEKSFEKVEDVFNIFKTLITEQEYSRDVVNVKKGYEVQTFTLQAESIAAVYSTVQNSFVNDDDQLLSRTVKSVPAPVSTDQLLKREMRLNVSFSVESLEIQKVQPLISEFQEFLKSLVNTSVEIINPYESVFLRFVEGSEVSIRELRRQLKFFEVYCLMTLDECVRCDDFYIASVVQLQDYFNHIALENSLSPISSAFLKMLLGSDLSVIGEEVELNKYFNEILEDFEDLLSYECDGLFLDDLTLSQEKEFCNKLMKKFRLGSSRENVFFTVADLKRKFRNRQVFNDIDDLSKLLYSLSEDGYIQKIEYKYRNMNIYYLTSKCDNMNEQVVLSDEDKRNAKEFLKEIGVII